MPSPRHHSRSTIQTDVATAAAVTAALRAHGAAIAPTAPKAAAELVNSALHVLAEEARYVTGANGAAIALEDGNEMLCRAAAGALSPGLGWRLDAQSGFSGECVRTARVLRCDDAENDPRVDAAICRQLGIRSILAAPIVSSDRVKGIFELFSDRPLSFNAEDEKKLAALAVEAAALAFRASMSRPWPAVAVPAAPLPVPAAAAAGNAYPAQPQEAARVQIAAPAVQQASADPLPTWYVPGLLMQAEESEHSPAVEWVLARKNALAAAVGTALMVAFLGLFVRTVTKPAISNPVVSDAQAASTEAESSAQPESSADEATGAGRERSIAAAPLARRPAASSAKAARKSAAEPGAHRSELRPGARANSAAAIAPPSAAALAQASQPQRSLIAELGSPPIAAPETPRVRVTQGATPAVLLHSVKPVYPAAALAMRVQGAVVLVATISSDGHVRNLRAVSGNPLLQAAARNAVSDWVYQPSKLNGVPHAVQTEITVKFVLPK
jgi:TonB family protein